MVYERPEIVIGFVAAREPAQEIETSPIYGSVQPGDMGKSYHALAAHLRLLGNQRAGDSGQDRVRVRMVQRQSDHAHSDEWLAPDKRGIDLLGLLDPSQR